MNTDHVLMNSKRGDICVVSTDHVLINSKRDDISVVDTDHVLIELSGGDHVHKGCLAGVLERDESDGVWYAIK